MQKLDLTKWLEMVWRALKEPDKLKRNRLLRAADKFLQEHDEPLRTALPPLGGEKRAA
jgi:hypothetical protein